MVQRLKEEELEEEICQLWYRFLINTILRLVEDEEEEKEEEEEEEEIYKRLTNQVWSKLHDKWQS